MSNLVFQHAPNRITASAAPGDTSWHKLTIPTGVPIPSGSVNISVAICTMATSGTAGGSPVFVDFDKSTNPTIGFPVLGTDVFGMNINIYYKLTVSTDTVYFIFAW